MKGRLIYMQNILIGGAWPYANGPLHIGHIAALLPGDVLARYFRAKGDETASIMSQAATATARPSPSAPGRRDAPRRKSATSNTKNSPQYSTNSASALTAMEKPPPRSISALSVIFTGRSMKASSSMSGRRRRPSALPARPY